ncbi:MAG: tRNA guanosine(34) transglycosylase Tgt, partial [Myxococcales bacterium]|nr:tRNA guanosine(34) transglycosylase Tgt [Myxococcales bacterium]
QVFSLKKRSVTEDGVGFRYELDGKQTFLSPEVSMGIQQSLGSDIAMVFDECLPADSDYQTVRESIGRTARWAQRSKDAHIRTDQSLFGIIQGAMFPDLREQSAEQILSIGFDGYAVGGLAVGEEPEQLYQMTEVGAALLPEDRPRYLMGVGRPQDLVTCVQAGIDMFDCVIPTRHARGGLLYTFQGRVRVTDKRYRRDGYSLDTSCHCYACSNFSRAYIHHLFRVGEVLGTTLATIHNLYFFERWMEKIRAAIIDGTLNEVADEMRALYPERDTQSAADRSSGD